MNPSDVFNVATKIETPLMLAGLVVLVLYALFRSRVSDSQAKMLFVLALVAIVVGVAADLVRLKTKPPDRYWLDGRVYSPPTKPTAGVPMARVFLEAHGRGVETTCTDKDGYFKFEIPPELFKKQAKLWVSAQTYQDTEPKPVLLAADLEPQEIGISQAGAAEIRRTSIVVPPPRETEQPTRATDSLQCLAGDWHEQLAGRADQPKTFQWSVSFKGTTLHIVRQDNFVSGDFQRSDGAWKGDLGWGNHEVWHNVLLTPSPDCHTIATNQFWYYKR